MSLINSEDKRSYSTLNLFLFVVKFFFERKKRLDKYVSELTQCIPTGRDWRKNESLPYGIL